MSNDPIGVDVKTNDQMDLEFYKNLIVNKSIRLQEGVHKCSSFSELVDVVEKFTGGIIPDIMPWLYFRRSKEKNGKD